MARKVSLREFQQALVRRLSEAATSAAPSARLGILSGGDHWLVRLEEAGEVIPVPRLTPVPLTRRWFRGLANIRGNLYSVIDYAMFCGGEPTHETPDCRLLLVSDRYHMNAALLVSKMLGLRNIQGFEAQAGAEGERPWASTRYIDGEGRAWRELSMSDLVYNNDFLEAGA
jgi:twitching motility protein PilI